MTEQDPHAEKTNSLPWMEANFSERQRKEIKFCLTYASDFNHGTDGHNAKIILARLASLLNSLHFQLVGRNYPENIAPIQWVIKLKDEKWVRVKETAHKKVLLFLLLIGFINGAAFGFGIAYLFWMFE